MTVPSNSALFKGMGGGDFDPFSYKVYIQPASDHLDVIFKPS